MKFLHDIMLAKTGTRGACLAIVTRQTFWTYAEFQGAVDLFSTYLQKMGAGLEDRILITADTTPEAIALITACSKVGATFTVISKGTPALRVKTIIDELDPSAILSQEVSQENQAYESFGIPSGRFTLEDGITFALCPNFRGNGLRTRRLDIDLAYILFTSGSTGVPKGIAMSHLATVSFLRGLIEEYGLPEGERYATSSPLQFDYALLDIGLCLGSGGTLILPSLALIRKPGLLAEELRSLEVKHFSGVPTLWKLMLRFAPEKVTELKTLRRVVFAGEHFPIEHIAALDALLPGLRLFNIYGQSESIACTFADIPLPLADGTTHLPVGRGHSDVEMFLIDDLGGVITHPGLTGELYLRGNILFSGYWSNPRETQARLVQHPTRPELPERVFRSGDTCYFDAEGVFYFVGRKDTQIKINGNRVEIEEIEAALCRNTEVSEACVVPVVDEEQTVLHAFMVMRAVLAVSENESNRVASLRRHAMDVLPGYMRPQQFHFLEVIPLTANGKCDRKQLAEIITGR